MPIGPYTICPGGTGKKVKFCCPDLQGELEQLQTMLDGDQVQAALRHVERLDEKHPGRACLMGIKAMLLRESDQIEAAAATAEAYRLKHPNNARALAESATIEAIQGHGRQALDYLQQSLDISGNEIQLPTYLAIGAVCQALAAEGHFAAVRMLTMLQYTMRNDDQEVMEFLIRMNSNPAVPLVVRQERTLQDPPAGVPWADEFHEAATLADTGRWLPAAKRFTALAERFPDSPVLWHNVAVVRSWLADDDASAEAWRKYASLESNLEDASEAEALAMYLGEDPLGDDVDMLSLEFPVKDAEQLQIHLLSSKRVQQARGDLSQLVSEEGGIPPRAAFALFDRPVPGEGDALTLQTVPQLIGQALLFGRQTDRPARLEVINVLGPDRDAVVSLLKEVGAGEVESLDHEHQEGKVSGSLSLVSRQLNIPQWAEMAEARQILTDHFEQTVYETWPQRPLGCLGGKSPQEAAADPGSRAKVMAAILVLEHFFEQAGAALDANRMRTRLGLPELGPIEPSGRADERVPLPRLHRMVVEKLSNEALVLSYRRAVAFSIAAALRKFGRALIERPGITERDEVLRAYSLLVRLAESPEESLGYVERGRQAAATAGQSSAMWDMMELSIQFRQGNSNEVSRLFNHIRTEHVREPGVAQALNQWLAQIGALRQQAGAQAAAAQQEAAAGPGIVIPGETPAAESGKLWTPDGGTSAGGDKPKLWTPDMG